MVWPFPKKKEESKQSITLSREDVRGEEEVLERKQREEEERFEDFLDVVKYWADVREDYNINPQSFVMFQATDKEKKFIMNMRKIARIAKDMIPDDMVGVATYEKLMDEAAWVAILNRNKPTNYMLNRAFRVPLMQEEKQRMEEPKGITEASKRMIQLESMGKRPPKL